MFARDNAAPSLVRTRPVNTWLAHTQASQAAFSVPKGQVLLQSVGQKAMVSVWRTNNNIDVDVDDDDDDDDDNHNNNDNNNNKYR